MENLETKLLIGVGAMVIAGSALGQTNEYKGGEDVLRNDKQHKEFLDSLASQPDTAWVVEGLNMGYEWNGEELTINYRAIIEGEKKYDFSELKLSEVPNWVLSLVNLGENGNYVDATLKTEELTEENDSLRRANKWVRDFGLDLSLYTQLDGNETIGGLEKNAALSVRVPVSQLFKDGDDWNAYALLGLYLNAKNSESFTDYETLEPLTMVGGPITQVTTRSIETNTSDEVRRSPIIGAGGVYKLADNKFVYVEAGAGKYSFKQSEGATETQIHTQTNTISGFSLPSTRDVIVTPTTSTEENATVIQIGAGYQTGDMRIGAEVSGLKIAGDANVTPYFGVKVGVNANAFFKKKEQKTDMQ